jgi:hypothetical protein
MKAIVHRHLSLCLTCTSISNMGNECHHHIGKFDYDEIFILATSFRQGGDTLPQ